MADITTNKFYQHVYYADTLVQMLKDPETRPNLEPYLSHLASLELKLIKDVISLSGEDVITTASRNFARYGETLAKFQEDVKTLENNKADTENNYDQRRSLYKAAFNISSDVVPDIEGVQESLTRLSEQINGLLKSNRELIDVYSRLDAAASGAGISAADDLRASIADRQKRMKKTERSLTTLLNSKNDLAGNMAEASTAALDSMVAANAVILEIAAHAVSPPKKGASVNQKMVLTP